MLCTTWMNHRLDHLTFLMRSERREGRGERREEKERETRRKEKRGKGKGKEKEKEKETRKRETRQSWSRSRRDDFRMDQKNEPRYLGSIEPHSDRSEVNSFRCRVAADRAEFLFNLGPENLKAKTSYEGLQDTSDSTR